LIELVIVVVIISIIAAIAMPRMSRGAAGAADSSLSGNLATLRKAIDLYAVEHNNKFPDVATFKDELTKYTDNSGNVTTDGTNTKPYIYGPYLRDIPPLPVGAEKGSTTVAAAAAATIGWGY